MSTSLYVHIPYCKSICTYCDFCKMYYRSDQVNDYLFALERELKKVYQKEKMKTIYIGGGTPSCLSIEELKHLFRILDYIEKDAECEYTIECNFDSISKEKLELFLEAGINRLSFGVETINPTQMSYLGRHNTEEDIRFFISYAKRLGFTNINVDLIYALPNETVDILKKDLEFLLSLDVSHISTYSLMLEENTILSLKGEKSIDSDLDASMYEYIVRTLKQHGYEHYEISNFSKCGFSSKHNLVYWHNQEYYGIGLGAASYHQKKRSSNTRSITNYLKGKTCLLEEIITEYDEMVYEVLLGLRLVKGIDLEHFQHRFKKSLSEVFIYDKLMEEHLLEEVEGFLRIPEEKLYISNYIIEELVYGKE